MSKDIGIARAKAAEHNIKLTLSSCQNVCTNLIDRMKKKLSTKNPYLISFASGALHQLEFCDEKISLLKNNTKKLSENANYVLIQGSIQLLDAIRRLELLIQPFEYDWVFIPRDVREQYFVVCDAIFFVVADLYVIPQIAELTCKLSTQEQATKLEGIRRHLIKRRDTTARIKVATASKKSLSVDTESFLSNWSFTSTLTPTKSDDCSDIDIDSQGRRSSANEQSDQSRIADNYDFERCESLAVDLLDALNVTSTTTALSRASNHAHSRTLMYYACKIFLKQKTGHIHSMNDARINQKRDPEPESDTTLEYASNAIIDAMSPEITDRDIATLVLHWTTVDKFNGFNRVSSLPEPETTKCSQIHIDEKSEDKSEQKVKRRRWRPW